LNSGRIDVAKCRELFSKLISLQSIDDIFLCGPEEMIFSVSDFLEQSGVDRKKIHFELFTTPAQKKYSKTQGADINSAVLDSDSTVQIKLDGIVSSFKLAYGQESILNAALKEGIDLPFACKGGVCASCRAKLEDGEVEMDVNYALEPEEVKEGFILTCQSHPRSEKVIVNFDVR
jgi:ring-1,2-phenylacetyl-CoA epoxidase subunit PaaE